MASAEVGEKIEPSWEVPTEQIQTDDFWEEKLLSITFDIKLNCEDILSLSCETCCHDQRQSFSHMA